MPRAVSPASESYPVTPSTTSTYETSDLYLASFLKARGMRLNALRRDGRRATFVFEDCTQRTALIAGYYNDDVVRVNDFKNALQDLKAAVFNI